MISLHFMVSHLFHSQILFLAGYPCTSVSKVRAGVIQNVYEKPLLNSSQIFILFGFSNTLIHYFWHFSLCRQSISTFIRKLGEICIFTLKDYFTNTYGNLLIAQQLNIVWNAIRRTTIEQRTVRGH